jgi:hypothetical protein
VIVLDPSPSVGLVDWSSATTNSGLYTLGNYGSCPNGLTDGKFWSEAVSGMKCCTTTSSSTSGWISLGWTNPIVVQDIFVIAREGTGYSEAYSATYSGVLTTGGDFYVGNLSPPTSNVACGIHPTISGLYNCGGKIGKSVGYSTLNSLYYLSICQIRVYSYKLNGYTGWTWGQSASSAGSPPWSTYLEASLRFATNTVNTWALTTGTQTSPAYVYYQFD